MVQEMLICTDPMSLVLEGLGKLEQLVKSHEQGLQPHDKDTIAFRIISNLDQKTNLEVTHRMKSFLPGQRLPQNVRH